MHTRACCTVVTQWTLQQRQSKMQAPEQICPSGGRCHPDVGSGLLRLHWCSGAGMGVLLVAASNPETREGTLIPNSLSHRCASLSLRR